jgi:type II secretory pathway component PulF
MRLLALRLQKSRLRVLCAGIWSKLGEGQSLSVAMGGYPKVFDGQTLNLIAAGEATGNIRDVLERLITHFTEQKEFKRKLISAMAYPLFICVIAVGVVIFFVLFLLPRLQQLLSSLGGKLPLSTKLLMTFADVFVVVGPIFVVVAILTAIGIARWRKTEEGKIASDALLLRVPLAGSFVMRVSVLNFCHTLAVLLENGITTAEALRLAEKTAPNRALRQQLREATDRVLEGDSLSKALGRTGYFPRLLLDRVAVAEQTGNLAPGLRDISRSYRAELDRTLTPAKIRRMPGAAELAVALDTQGAAVGLLTGNYEETAQVKIRAAGYNHMLFPFGAFGADGPSRRHLTPVAMARAAAHPGRVFEPARVTIIGDTPLDVDCAKAHGCRAIGVATGPYSSTQLRDAGADLAVENLADTEELLRWILAL